jgi:hypothetical protein
MTLNLSRHLRKAKIAYEPDGQWQDVGVEVKFQTHGFRDLRASLLQRAYWLTSNPKSRGVLVLVGSRITEEGLQEEWRLAEKVLHPDVVNRLTVAVGRDKQYIGLPSDLGDDFCTWLDQLILEQSHKGKPRDSFYAIFQILLHQWLLAQGPTTSAWLMETAGCSYPTVRDALRRLDHYLLRHSDRRVELRYFPKDEWARLLAVSDHVRSTARLADRSGQPRSPESHIRRLEKLNISNLAVGGVIGTKHYYPNLDLVGTPRLDLSLHCPGRNLDLSFIEKLDPALKKVEDPLQPVTVAVHAVRRKDSFFEPGAGALSWADPVECLLDLHEARLESQAVDFLRALESRRLRKP